MQLSGFFITGTDTGTGKTAVGAALLYLMRTRGIRAAPVKPVQTGVAPGEPGDLEIYLKTSGLAPNADELSLMNPYRFRLPASPHLAAETEGAAVDIQRIEMACRTLAESYQALVVEGAGGLLVPLSRSVSTLELVSRRKFPLLVVARAGVGTINHSLLTLKAAGDAGITVAALVLNRIPEPSGELPPEQVVADNREIIARLSGAEVWEALPHVPGAGEEVKATQELAGYLEKAGAGKLIETFPGS